MYISLHHSPEKLDYIRRMKMKKLLSKVLWWKVVQFDSLITQKNPTPIPCAS